MVGSGQRQKDTERITFMSPNMMCVINKLTKNSELLRMFTNYCENHPEERFWQALCNWSGYAILASFKVEGGSQQWDTFNMDDDFSIWPRPENGQDRERK